MRRSLGLRWVLPVVGVALAWVALFKLNTYWFEFLSISPYVGWIFLPAALRLLAVLLFRARGVAGLLLGAAVTNDTLWLSDPMLATGLSASSALAPALALWLGARWLSLSSTLAGLSGLQLVALSALAAVCSSALHGLVFLGTSLDNHWIDSLVSMTVGDFVGTLLVLYSAYALMRWRRPKA